MWGARGSCSRSHRLQPPPGPTAAPPPPVPAACALPPSPPSAPDPPRTAMADMPHPHPRGSHGPALGAPQTLGLVAAYHPSCGASCSGVRVSILSMASHAPTMTVSFLKYPEWGIPWVQWLGLRAFTAEGAGSIPGWGTKIPQAVWRSQKITKYKSINQSPECLKSNMTLHPPTNTLPTPTPPTGSGGAGTFQMLNNHQQCPAQFSPFLTWSSPHIIFVLVCLPLANPLAPAVCTLHPLSSQTWSSDHPFPSHRPLSSMPSPARLPIGPDLPSTNGWEAPPSGL